jgi:hypothetical protein
VDQLDALRKEWDAWLEEAKAWPDSPEYDPNTCTEAIKDGRANINRHGVLREKTLTFIGNNFSGYGFIFAKWPSYPHEDNTCRRREMIPSWIDRLEQLAACIEYARVPDGYWTTKGKELVDEIKKVGTEKAIGIASAWLQAPPA